jgi:hypothetical protein
VALVGCRLLSGLLMQSVETAGLMEPANKFRFCLSGYDALNIRWVVPVPGLTGLPPHRIALATS